MTKTSIILSAALVATPALGQSYTDTLSDYALNDLSAILAAYDVGDYSSDDYNFAENYDSTDDSAYSGADSEYEEVGPADVVFGDYPSGFDDQYFDGKLEEIAVPNDANDANDANDDVPDFTDERLRPSIFSDYDFDVSMLPNGSGKLSQQGTGTFSATSFNNCRICKGQSAADCVTSNLQEVCNAVQPVCEITVRIARKGATPLYWSECKEKKSCYNNEQQNFKSSDKRFNQCKSTDMSARFAHGTACTFCTKLGTSTDQLLFRDTTSSDNALTILTTDGTTEINIADALKSPEAFFEKGGASYIYDSQAWYTDAMGNP